MDGKVRLGSAGNAYHGFPPDCDGNRVVVMGLIPLFDVTGFSATKRYCAAELYPVPVYEKRRSFRGRATTTAHVSRALIG